ncbi:MAG: aldehyde oxidase and xanthine dehydrogenase molybdopterin binding protein, partial [Gammaproteobacteria bacterium]|nr:aldehyde oxidase and xanthine dehydrogenase molybdopterin binding protein [Gammaproteobacteria bacterium]
SEDPLILMGKAKYVDDISLPGMVEIAFLRSSHAHAEIKLINLDKAKAHPVCIKIVTSADLDGGTTTFQNDQANLQPVSTPFFAGEKVRFVGEIIAAVVAPTRYIAEDIVDLIDVEYEALPILFDVDEAMKPGAELVHEEILGNVYFDDVFDKGDVEKAFRDADLVVKETVRTARTSAVPMETRGVIANWDWDDTLTVWSSTQMPYPLRSYIALWLRFPEQNIRVIAPHVGGGFGQKAHFFPEEFILPWIAKDIRKPIKWIEDRREHMLAAAQAKQMTMYIELAMKNDGTILGIKNKAIGDTGAYSMYPWGGIIDPAAGNTVLPGAFRFKNLRYRSVGVLTNKMAASAYRGVGMSGTTFAREMALTKAAMLLKLDLADIYHRNFIGRDEFPFITATNQTYDSGDYHKVLDKCLELSNYRKLKAQPRLLENGKLRGVGISFFVEPTAWGSRVAEECGFRGVTTHDSATVEIDPSGGVTVRSGQFGHGQGTKTTMAQVTAETLGVRFEDVRVLEGDTASGSYGMGTFASRSAVIGGGTVIRAAHDVRNKLLKIAAHVMEANAADLNIDEGVVFVKGSPDRQMTVRELAHITYFDRFRRPNTDDVEPVLSSTRHYDPPETYANGAHCVIIELDSQTGKIDIKRIVAVEDCGTMINPQIVEGQMRGGIAQAIGMALLESLEYDETGQLNNASFMDFLVPNALTLPDIECAHISTPSPLTEAGIKGCGEAAMLSVHCAFGGAVADALSEYGVLVPMAIPIGPQQVLDLIKTAGAPTR